MTCHLCQRTGQNVVVKDGIAFCLDGIACNARARARLGMAPWLCRVWKGRDLERKRQSRRRAA